MVPPEHSRRYLRCKRKTSRGDDSVVNKITWQRAGGVTEPGRYMFTFGWLTVTSDDLRIWSQFPDAAFTLVNLPSEPDAPEEFHLGAFDLPAPSSGEPPSSPK